MTENAELGREPFEAIYLYQDICSLTYGNSPCTALLADGGRKCFNTLPTCQDVANYTKESLVLRFCSNRVTVPNDGNYWFPLLKSVKVSPGAINPGGGDRSASPLGKRATLSATFVDHPHNDRIVDPYQDERVSGAAQSDGVGYDPLDRSTFWAKWRARNRYYVGRRIVHVSGYLKDGVVTDAIERSFFITDFSGPTSSDTVTITGKDVLSKAQNEKAKAPTFSNGKLSASLTDVATTFDVSPTGIGSEYPASGKVRISDEVMSYTRSGDTFTVTRGQRSTVAASHNSGDRVQWCLEYSSERPDDIVYDLLSTYAVISDTYLDTAGWAAEVDSFLPRLYSTLITEPTGVQALLSEMCEQMYFYVWFDERNDLVKLRAVRPAEDETVYTLTDSRHLVQDSINLTDATDQLITAVVVNYAQINPAKDLEEPSNYAATEIVLSDESGSDRLDESRTKVIYSRWLDSADGAAAIDIGTKLLARYSTVPRKMSFALDAKDREVWVGSFAQVTHRRAVDDTGLERPVNIQIMTASESVPGTTFSYMGQEFVFEEPPSTTDKTIDISANLTDVNLRTLYDSKYGTAPISGDNVTVTVRSGVVIGGTSTANYAISTGSWPSGVTLNLVIQSSAVVAGKGGAGGRGGKIPSGTASELNGGAGGDAISSTYPLNVTNLGIIGGGGGGGGGGQSITGNSGTFPGNLAGGGGGGGAGSTATAGGPVGTGSSGAIFDNGNGYPGSDGGEGSTAPAPSFGGNRGTAGFGGLGAKFSVFTGATGPYAGNGGIGGYFGQDGSDGSDGNAAYTEVEAAGTGGAAGRAVVGISNVTWINKGIVWGAEV